MEKLTFVATIIIASLLVSGCGRSPAPDPSAGGDTSTPVNSNRAPADVTVELSSNQLSAIKIAPVGTYIFPQEKQAVGSVCFEEDPAIVQAESTLLAAAATFVVTSNELARAQTLYDTNGVSQRELEQATSDEQTAGAALKAARDALRALGKTDAEIDSLIAAGKINSSPATSSTTNWVLAYVLESDSPWIQPGQAADIKIMALPGRAFNGQVSKIYATIDPNAHRLPVRCEVNDPEQELRPGMLANITIHVAPPLESIGIPANGVVREGDGTMTVWVTTDRRHFTQKTVKTGLGEDGEVQILDGLQRGELVVTDGAIFLDNMVNATPSD